MDEPKKVVQLDYAAPRKRAVPVWAWVLIGMAVLVVIWYALLTVSPSQPAPSLQFQRAPAPPAAGSSGATAAEE